MKDVTQQLENVEICLENLEALAQYVEICLEYCPTLKESQIARTRVSLLLDSYRAESASWLEELKYGLRDIREHLLGS